MNIVNTERAHILVVDDEESIRNMLQQLIYDAGYECSHVGNAREALKVLEEKNVDVVISDINMPGLNGIELTRIIKEKYDSDVIVITGFAVDMKFEDVINTGARDFMQKPLNINELLIRLKHILSERAIFSEWKRTERNLKKSIIKFERVLESTVYALASALEKRDPYTSSHQRRVTKLYCVIAKKMGLSDTQIMGTRKAGLLHDIGKISLPIDILNKPGKLNEHEFNLIKGHPQVGYDILRNIEFEQSIAHIVLKHPIAQIVLQHHERMNGSGYPHGLFGEDIILQARILAVADVVESMASHRPYRPALGINKALDEILMNRGVLYDPEVVDTCLNLFAKEGFMFE